MIRNRNLLTENSKTQNYENINYKNKLKQNYFSPNISQSRHSHKFTENNDNNSFSNKKNPNFSSLIKNTNPIPSNGIINTKETSSRTNYSINPLKVGNNKNYNNIKFINNYKPKSRTFNIIRNGKDISKYLSKDFKRNETLKDNILNFDSNNSKNTKNVFYLINEIHNNTTKKTNSINNNTNTTNKVYYKRNYQQKISKFSLPFCVYSHQNEFISSKNEFDIKIPPPVVVDSSPILENENEKEGFDLLKNKNIIEEKKVGESIDDDMGNMTPNFLNHDYLDEKIPRKISDEGSQEEENEEKEEKEEEEKEEEEEEDTNQFNDIDNELSERNNISIHNFNNRIKIPHEHSKKRNNFYNYSKNKNKAKSMPKKIIKEKGDEDDDKGNKLRVKSVPKSSNNHPKFRKVKKIELLRDYNF